MNRTKNRKYQWSLLFALIMIGVTFYIIFKNNEIKQIIPIIREASAFYLILGLLLMLFFNICEALAIKVLMKSFSYTPTFGQCLKYAFIGFYFCSITPTSSGGQPMQVYYMKKDGIEIGSATMSILIITVSYQIGMLLLGLLMFILRPVLVSGNLGFSVYFIAFGVASNLFMAVTIISVAFQVNFLKNIITGIIRFLARIRIIKKEDLALQKIEGHLYEYQKCIGYIRKNPRVLSYTLAIIITQILTRLSVAFVVYKAFGLQGYNFIDIVALQMMLALAVESLPLPGAIGASETGFLAINTKIFGSSKLVPAMLLSRGINFYSFLLISGVISMAAQISDKSVPVNKKR